MKLYTVNELLEMLQVSRKTMYKYIADEKIKGSKVGNKWLFTEKQVNDFLESRQSKWYNYTIRILQWNRGDIGG